MASLLLAALLILLQCVEGYRMITGLPMRHLLSKRFPLAFELAMSQKDILMPALSSTMKEGKIVSWNKKIGDKVSAGEVLLVVESDKADMDVESFDDGYLAAIFTPEGGSAAVGAVVASLVENAADLNKVKAPGSSSSNIPAPAAVVTENPSTTAAPAASTGATPQFDQILMPALSSTMKEGKVVSWNKKVGDKISAGDMVLVVESDKADMDVESYEDGYLAAILVGDGQVAPVGAPVAYLAKSPEAIAEIQSFVKSGGKPSSSSTTASATLSSSSPATTTVASTTTTTAAATPAIVNDGRIAASGYAKKLAKDQGIDLRTVSPSRPDHYIVSKDLAMAGSSSSNSGQQTAEFRLPPGMISATPTARKLAQENNIDLATIKGSGNFGRIVPDDVLKAAGKYVPPVVSTPPAATAGDKKPAAASTTTSSSSATGVLDGAVEMNGMQKAIAKNMEATLSIPVFRVSKEICTDKLDELYAVLKPKGVTVSAMLAKAVALALEKHPLINAGYKDGKILYHKDVNVAMAVAIDGGLITPVIKKCQDLDLFSISRSWKELIEKAKGKKLAPDEYSSGTITISNLGMFGVNQFDAILPPGMGSILAVSSSFPKVVPQANGFFGVKKYMTITITCDHRHIYGAHAAEFMKDLAGTGHISFSLLSHYIHWFRHVK